MGMGEPLLNLDRVLESIAALNDPRRLGLGARHITVSTSGVVPGIRRLTALGPQFTLAVSLHAARNPLRDVLVPLNRRWPVEEVVDAAREHAAATGRRVTYEVTMIDGINDTDVDADALAELLRGDLAHVNLIPMNQVAHTPWTGTPIPVIERFADRVRAAGIDVDDPVQPRHRDRRRVRPARGRARRPARARSSSSAAASGSSPRARRPCAASAATSRSRPGWGRADRGQPPARARADRREHPRLGPRRARRRDPARRGGGRGPDPPRRDGRPLRAQPHLRLEDDRGRPAGHHDSVRRPPDDLRARALDAAVPRRRLRLDHVPRRGRRAADRAGPGGDPRGGPVGRAVGQAGDAADARSTPIATCSTSSS